jgi:tRNA(Ile)-lysidine synthetase-like protein
LSIPSLIVTLSSRLGKLRRHLTYRGGLGRRKFKAMSAALLDSLMRVLSRHALTDRFGIIAVSGGPDSTALAHLSVQLVRQGKLAGVTFAHLNHQLRGGDSDGDERFVLGLPAAWGVPEVRVMSGRVDVAARAREAGDNLENVGRQTRYSWLAETARSLGAGWVATGHTADDQAETVLHHFLRGSGAAGLAGIPECRALESDDAARGRGEPAD